MPTRRNWLASTLLLLGVTGAAVIAQPPKVSTYFSPNRQREDFTAAVDNQTFQATGPGVGSYLEVYRNGSLQREGNPAGDYTTVSVGGARKVTFNPNASGPVPVAGDYITLFYYK